MNRKKTPPKTDESGAPRGIRLQVYLARSGIGSRRQCEEHILARRVRVNGTVVDRLGSTVSGDDTVLFNNKPVRPVKKLVYIVLNKPVKYLCSNKDDSGKPLANELLKTSVSTRLFHVGRLDYMSSGLVFYTNDGLFAQVVTRPAYEIDKEYVIDTKKPMSESFLNDFKRGVMIDRVTYRIKTYKLIAPTRVRITLNEGKNREIRNVFEHFRLTIKRLHRIRIGIVTIHKLQLGDFRSLTKNEVEWFLNKSRESAADFPDML